MEIVRTDLNKNILLNTETNIVTNINWEDNAQQYENEVLESIDRVLLGPERRSHILSEKEKKEIKKVSKEILEKLKNENKLVIDWRKKQQARADVKITIDDLLYDGLPKSYVTQEYQLRLDLVYRHVYDSYYGENKSVYVARERV